MVAKVPYTQQFTPASTPLHKLIPILRQQQGKTPGLAKAIGSAFFGSTKTPGKMAQNTLIALKYHGIINGDCGLTSLGSEMVSAPPKAAELLAKNILLNHGGMLIVETLREMKSSNTPFSLGSITRELRIRGFTASGNSSDLSGVLGWLREAGVLVNYDVNEERYADIIGATPRTIDALKDLPELQILFLRALVALGVKGWTSHALVVQHAEKLYQGQVTYDWKELDRTVLTPLSKAGFIETRKAPKSATEARGGKPTEIRGTERFEREVAEAILAPMYEAAGFRDVRKIRSIPFDHLIVNIQQKGDDNLRANALEILAIRICQLLDLDFMGWRETDEELVAGGEVDGFMHTARLIYSRWQIQCKASEKITYEALAKEVGVAEVTLANIILIVGTGTVTSGAETYRKRIVSKSPLNIIVINGQQLDAIAKNPAAITGILQAQAQDAMQTKPQPSSLIRKKPEEGEGDGGKGGPMVQAAEPKPERGVQPKLPYYSTSAGSMYLGDAYEVMSELIRQGVKVKLLFTSPPFALVRKKAYGNEEQDHYVAWFMRFVPLFHQILGRDGSFVMDIGGSWIPGLPARSVYQYKLLLRICDSGFYLAQEFYHYNPARLPTPAEWVTVRRMRVKDAMNNVWWFAKDPLLADANNRRVLREYSQSMKDLIANGYTAKLRPSGHDISEKFQKDNNGAIPPNLIELANTESNSLYLRKCREAGIPPHPARFPVGLPDWFIRFLTKPGDLVMDPFAGSNVTGESAEKLGRKWIASEIEEQYVIGSKFRFVGAKTGAQAVGNGKPLKEPLPKGRSKQLSLDR